MSQNGTNNFHGSFFGKVNAPELNAYNRWGGPHGESPQRVNNELNQWEQLGGPIVKNHLFFFFSTERTSNNLTTVESHWVETPDFVSLAKSARPNSLATQILSVPGMAPKISRVVPRDCASFGLSDATQCQTLSNGLDIGSPAASAGQRVTAIGGGLDNVADIQFVESPFFNNATAQQWNGRLDFQVTQSDLFAFSMYFVPSDTSFNQSWSGQKARPVEDFSSSRRNMNAALLWTRTLSPTMVNEARINVTRWYFNEITSNPDVPWGIPQDTVSDSRFNVVWGMFGPGVFYQTTYNFRDTLSKVVNTHAMNLGVDIAKEQNNDTVAWAARPSFNFDNLWNFLNDAPNTENGNFDPRNGYPTDLKKYVRSGNYALFVQDDWKVRPNLTLNLGLRWEHFTPLRAEIREFQQSGSGSGDNPLLGTSMQIGETTDDTDNMNFGPQFGFAWSPISVMGHDLNNKWVLRGGFGIGFNRVPESLSLNGRLNPPFFGSFNLPAEQTVYSLSTEGIGSFYGWPSNPSTQLIFDPNTNLPIGGTNLASRTCSVSRRTCRHHTPIATRLTCNTILARTGSRTSPSREAPLTSCRGP